MTNTLKNNAYQILGLSTSSAQKEIVKRSKEIINRLKIDDYPEYEADIPFFGKSRTEESTKTALQNIQSPKKKIKEYFFWFQLDNEIDEKAFLALRNSDSQTAIQLWDEASKSNNAKSFLYKKNLAILYCILLDKENNESNLKKSISLWKDVITSEKFWELFFKSYELSDDQSTSIDILNEFKISAPSYLSDIYTELHSKYQTSIYINEFQQAFSQKSEKMEKSVLSPIYESINNNIEDLGKLVINKDGSLDKPEMEKIKPLIQSIQADLNRLIDLGLYDDSQTKILRDKAVEAIRRQTLELYNNLNESEKSEALLKIALQIVGTTGLEEKIKQEIKTIQEMKKNLVIVQPVLDWIEKGNFEIASQVIELEMKKHADNHDLIDFYISKKKFCISSIAVKKWKQAHDTFKDYPNEAAPLFSEAGKLIYDNIELFDFNKEPIDNIIAEIKSILPKVTLQNLDQLDEYRNKFVKLATEKFEGKFEETIFVVLIDGYIFGGLVEVINAVKEKKSTDNVISIIIQIVLWGAVMAIIHYFRS